MCLGNRPEVAGDNFASQGSSEVDVFLAAVREVRKRNCLSKHASNFDIVMLMFLQMAYGVQIGLKSIYNLAC